MNRYKNDSIRWRDYTTRQSTCSKYAEELLHARARLRRSKSVTGSSIRPRVAPLLQHREDNQMIRFAGRIWRRVRDSTRVTAVKETRPIVIQRNFAAWIALYEIQRTDKNAYWTLVHGLNLSVETIVKFARLQSKGLSFQTKSALQTRRWLVPSSAGK